MRLIFSPFRTKPEIASLVCCALFASTTTAAPVEIIPPGWKDAQQPQAAVAPDGRVHVVFGRDTSIYHTASSDRRTFSPPVKVGTLNKLALGRRRGPRVSATVDVVVVTAVSHADGQLHAWTSADGGESWSEQRKINDAEKSAREGLHAMTGNGSGLVLATWLDLRSGATELWGATSRDGGLSWSANSLVYRSPDGHICECCHPSAAMNARGQLAVMWRNWLDGSRDMYEATSSDGGQTFTPAQKLGEDTWKLNGCPMDGGAMALSPGGEAVTVWRRENASYSDRAGKKEVPLAPSAMQPVVVAGSDGVYFLWESDGGLVLQKEGSKPVRFAENAAFAAAASGGPLHDPVIVWESSANGRKTLLMDSPESAAPSLIR